MSRHRAILVALATLLTAGTTSAALACCEWGSPAPIAYQWSGCGGCGPAVAPVTYAAPVLAGGCGGCGAPLATYAQPFVPPLVAPAVGWGGGCGCSGCGGCGGYATPAIEPTPIAPSPIYVVNQGPDYTGPGLMVPYRVYAPGAGYAPPPAYSYVTGESLSRGLCEESLLRRGRSGRPVPRAGVLPSPISAVRRSGRAVSPVRAVSAPSARRSLLVEAHRLTERPHPLKARRVRAFVFQFSGDGASMRLAT